MLVGVELGMLVGVELDIAVGVELDIVVGVDLDMLVGVELDIVEVYQDIVEMQDCKLVLQEEEKLPEEELQVEL